MQKAKFDLNIAVEDLSQVKKKLVITVPAEAVKSELVSSYSSIKATMAIAGFRKGTVPLNIIKTRFGEQVQEDVAKKLVESSCTHALNEKSLVPVASPFIEVVNKLEEGKDFKYSATVEVTPRVEVDGYRGLELKFDEVVVTDADLEESLKSLCESRAQFNPVEREAADGDLVEVDFEAFIDGEPIKNGKATDYATIIGAGTLLPGFDDALKGAKKGEKKSAILRFPDVYSQKELAGKEATFEITVKSVKEKSLPVLDDEFAKALQCEDVDDLKAKVKAEIGKSKENEEKERVKNSILDKLIEKHAFDVPEALVNRYLAIILNKVLENMRAGIIMPADRGLTPEQLREKYREVSARHVKEDIILDAIAEREKVQISKEESEVAITQLAAERKISYEALLGRIQTEGAYEVIIDGLKHEKVFEIIIAAAKVAA